MPLQPWGHSQKISKTRSSLARSAGPERQRMGSLELLGEVLLLRDWGLYFRQLLNINRMQPEIVHYWPAGMN